MEKERDNLRAAKGMFWYMVWAILIVAVLVTFCSRAHAREWSALDYSLQATFLLEMDVDRAQTVYAAKHRTTLYSDPGNPASAHPSNQEDGFARAFIGRYPSVGQVNGYFVTSALLHTAITAILIHCDAPKPAVALWQGFWIGVETNAINHNVNAGISVRF